MTAAGLLACQQLGLSRGSPKVVAGAAILMNHLPANGETDASYSYWGSRAIHNQLGPDWDVWSRANRKRLATSQSKPGTEQQGSWNDNCAATSSPSNPEGRFFTTCINVLTLNDSACKCWLYDFQQADSEFGCEAFAWEFESR